MKVYMVILFRYKSTITYLSSLNADVGASFGYNKDG